MSDVQRALLVDRNGEPIILEASSANGILVSLISATGGTLSGAPSSDSQSAANQHLRVMNLDHNFNGTSYDRVRNNIEAEALASAARTAAINSADIINYNHKGIIVYLDITVDAVTADLTLSIEAKDPSSGKYIKIFTASAAASAVGMFTYVLYPGSVTADDEVTEVHLLPLPRTFRISIAVADADEATYSVGYALLP